jgi:hypothetical protein
MAVDIVGDRSTDEQLGDAGLRIYTLLLEAISKGRLKAGSALSNDKVLCLGNVRLSERRAEHLPVRDPRQGLDDPLNIWSGTDQAIGKRLPSRQVRHIEAMVPL